MKIVIWKSKYRYFLDTYILKYVLNSRRWSWATQQVRIFWNYMFICFVLIKFFNPQFSKYTYVLWLTCDWLYFVLVFTLPWLILSSASTTAIEIHWNTFNLSSSQLEEVLVELSYESCAAFIFCFPEIEPGIELSVSILGFNTNKFGCTLHWLICSYEVID